MKSADFVIPSEGEYKTPEQAINEQAGMVRLATSEVPKFVTAENQKYAVIDGSNPVNGITIAPVTANRKGEEEIDQSAAQLITPEMYPQFLEFDAENNGWLQPEQLQSDSPNGAEITPLAETKSSYPLDKNGQPDIEKMDEVQLFNYNKETFGEETAIEDAKGDLKLISDKILKAQKKLETADTKTKIKTRLEISALNERKAKLEGLLPQVTSEAPAAPIQSTEPITPQVSDNNLSQISDINATEPTVQESLTVEPVQMPKELNINEQNTQLEKTTQPENIRIGEKVIYKNEDDFYPDISGLMEDYDGNYVWIRTPNGTLVKTKPQLGIYITHTNILENKSRNIVHGNSKKTDEQILSEHSELFNNIDRLLRENELPFNDIYIGGSFVGKDKSNDIDIVITKDNPKGVNDKKNLHDKIDVELYEDALSDYRYMGLPINVIEVVSKPDLNETAFGRIIKVTSRDLTPQNATIKKPINAETPQTANKAESNVQESSDLRNTTKTVEERKSENLQKAPENGTESGKEPWQMTRVEYQRQMLKPIPIDELRTREEVTWKAFAEHEQAVQQAISEGKPVPEEVLNDYPELKPSNTPSFIPSNTPTNEIQAETQTTPGETQAEVLNPSQDVTSLSPVEQSQSEPIKEKSPVTGSPEPVSPAVSQSVAGNGVTLHPELSKETLSAQKKRLSETKPKFAGEVVNKNPSVIPNRFTVKSFSEFEKDLNDGKITIDEFKEAFNVFSESKEYLLSELQSMTKVQLLDGMNSYGKSRYKNEKKEDIVKALYDNDLMTFAFGTVSYSHGSSLYEAIKKGVEASTQDDIDKHVKDVAKRREEYKQRLLNYKKSLTNPETLEEFKIFIDNKGISALSPEQKAAYDLLITDKVQEKRKNEQEKKSEIAKVELGDTTMKVIPTKHTKTGQDLFVVQLSDRVERSVYDDLNAKAKKLGGYYSSFRGNGAVPGFQFKTQEQAEKFISLQNENVSNIDVVKKKQEEKLQKRADKLRESAENVIQSADEELNKDRLTNTYRRANQANAVEERARQQKRIGQTMLNIADAIDNGDVKLLDGIKSRTHIELLDNIVSGAKYSELRAKYPNDIERHRGEPATVETVEYIRDGYLPSLYKPAVTELLNKVGDKPGLKLISARWKKNISGTGEYYQLKSDKEFDELVELFNGLSENDRRYHSFTDVIANHKRLKSIGIGNDSMLRAALREYIQYRGKKQEVDKVKELERKLVGKNVGFDFFPTPKSVAQRMVSEADVQDGMSVLEPSAGTGNIADAIKEEGVKPDVVELSSELSEVLKAKGYNLVATDFMEYSGKKYDRIIMNPPFSNGLDGDHVKHAYDLLNPGGRIVAIVGQGTLYRSDKKSVAFRGWLDSVGAYIESLPEGTFNDKTLLNTTGANASIVTINKDDNDIPQFSIIGERGDITSPRSANDVLIQHKSAIDSARTLDEKHGAIQAFVDEMKGVGFDTPVILCKTRQNVIEEYAKTNPTKENLERAKYTFSKPGIITEAFRTNGAIFICSENIIDSNRAFLSFFHETNHEGLRRSGENPFNIYNEFGDEFIKSVVPNQYHYDGEYTLGYEFPSALTEIAFQNSEIFSKFVAGEDVIPLVSDYFKSLNAGEYSDRLAELAIKPLNTVRNGKNDTSINPLPGRDGVFSKSNPRSVQGTDGFGKDGQETMGSLGRNDKEVNGQYSISKLSGRHSYSDQNDAGELSKVTKDTGGVSSSGVPSTSQDAGRAVGKTRRFAGDAIIPDRITIDEHIQFSKRNVSETGFYSTVENALDNIKQEKGTKEQFKVMLLNNGAKQAEMDWMGFEDHFAGISKMVTKSDIQKWIDDNRIDVREVEKGKNDKVALIEKELLNYGIRTVNYPDGSNFINEDGEVVRSQDVSSEIRDIMYSYRAAKDDENYKTKHSQWQLQGGSNYKELLLTIPEKNSITDKEREELEILGRKMNNDPVFTESDAKRYRELSQKTADRVDNNFKSSHFEERNIVAHVRFNERTDSEGNRVLFLEEIQSDWAQKGKKEGFDREGELKKKLKDVGVIFKSTHDINHYEDINTGAWFVNPIILTDKADFKVASPNAEQRIAIDNYNEYIRTNHNQGIKNIPDMPFKKTDQWVNLALRRMVRYAAENGFDRVAWTNGEQQAERYDLSKQVDEINYTKNTDGTYDINAIKYGEGKLFDKQSIQESELETYFGKDVSQKIINKEGRHYPQYNVSVLQGSDLKVGGEGMKAFYDQIIPNAAAKLGKPFGAKVEQIQIGIIDKSHITWDRNGAYIIEGLEGRTFRSRKLAEEWVDEYGHTESSTQQSIPITPEMRQSALEGMPLFSRKIIDGTPQNFSGFALPPKPPKPPKPPTFAGDYLNSPEFSKRSKAIKKSTVQAKRDMSAMGEKLVTGFDKFLSYAADQDLALKNFQDGVKKLGGTVTKDNDAYQIITTLSSRNAREAYHFNKDYFEPLETAVVNLTRDGSEAWEVTRYMKAKRSLEREDNEGLQTLNTDPNHPWSRQNVEKYVQDFEAKHPLRLIFELWDANKKAQTRIIDIAEESGKINSRYADNMRNRAKYYVPLRGWTYANPETQDPTEIFEYEHEAPNYQELQMTAEGRGSEAGDPLAYTRMLAISAIHSANRNKLKQRVANVLRENKDIPGIEKFGYFKNTYEELMDDGTWVEKEGIPTVAKMMKGTVRLFPEYTGNKKRITQQQAGENELAVYEKGRKIVMIFQDPEMKRVLTGRNQIGQEFLDSKFVQKYMANPVQYWKQLTTQWNPNFFLIKNPVRDLMGAVPSYWVTGGSMIEYNKDVLLADKHLARVFFDKGTGTSLDKLTQLWFDRGGLTMYATMDDVHKTARSIKKELSKLNNKIAFEDLIAGKADNLADIIRGTRNAAGRAVKKWLDFASMWGENRTRLGIFLAEVAKNTKYDASKGSIWDQAIAELNSGRNIDSEVLVSKEMSGNFNRKGRVSGLFGKFYPFWNPPLQSAYKHFNMAKDHPKRFGLMMAGIASMGFLWQMLLNALMGDEEYNKLKWRKYATITFPVGDYNISLPMGFVWNLPWSIGAGAYNVAKGFLEPKRYAMETASNLIQTATPFSTKVTDYGSMDMVRPFVPWALTLPYDIATNSDWSGKTIYNESPFNPNKPDSWLGKKNVNPILDKTFKGLNEATGGNQFKKGVVDWNPSKVEHTIQFIFSGLGKFGTQVANLAVDKDLSVNEIPIVYSFVSKGSEQSNYIEYKILKDKIEKYHSEIHNYEKNNMTKELNKYRDVRMDELYDYYSDINKDLKEMWDNESDAKQREEKMQILIDKAKELKVK